MKQIIYIALCVSLHGMAEPNVQYHPSVAGTDGAEAAFVTFKDGDREIRYVPPENWTVSDAHFQPSGKIMADAWIDTIPIQEAIQWDDEHVKKIQSWVLTSFVPNGSENRAVVSEKMNPLKIGSHDTYEITVSYNFYGIDHKTSILFVERGKTEFRFIFVARKQDFEELHALFMGSLFSVDGI